MNGRKHNMEDKKTISMIHEMLNTDEAAAYLGLARRTLEGMRWKKEGPKFVKLNRSVRYRKSDLDAYIEARIQG